MTTKGITVFVLVLFVVGLIVTYQISLWNECRSTNSFLYCLHILSGK